LLERVALRSWSPGAGSKVSVSAAASELTRRNRELDTEVRAAVKAKLARELPAPELSDYVLPNLAQAVRRRLEESGFDPELVAIGPPTGKLPPDAPRADLAFNASRAAKAAGQNPVEMAKMMGAALEGLASIAQASALGAFVNLRFDERRFADAVLSEVASLGPGYGRQRTSTRPLTILDYSHPNIAKNMTVAHLRSTIIGHALYKIHEATGAASFSVNHLGDWGTQFGKLLFEYERVSKSDPDGLQQALAEDPTATLMKLYRDFVEREDSDEAAVAAAQKLFLALEHGSPELVALWSRFREWSMRDFRIVYDRLQVDFDAYLGESFYEDKMQDTVAEALERGVLVRRADGAVVFPPQPLYDPTLGKWVDSAMLDQRGEPRDEIILKPTGGTVYLTRDLASLKYRTQTLGAEKLLYVIGKEQRIHCLLLFTIAEQLGYIEHGQALHVAFGHLNFHGQKMKSRAGSIVLLNDVIDDAISAAQKLSSGHGMADELDQAERDDVAKKVGIGSLVYNDLRQDRTGDIEFDPDIAGSLEAGQGPYIQYAYARLKGITGRFDSDGQWRVPDELAPIDVDVLFHIARLPGVLAEAAERNAPHRLAEYLNQLAQLSNRFYTERSVRDADGAERRFLIEIVKAAERTFEAASGLLMMELPEKM
jgi:arginyl-tRNA synthetase